MMNSPVVVCCFEDVGAIPVIQAMAGTTNGRVAAPNSIRSGNNPLQYRD